MRADEADWGQVHQILEENCHGCHGLPDEQPDGDFSLARFDSFEKILNDRPTWKKILEVVEGYEMPPAESGTLITSERTKLATWIRSTLAAPEFGDAPRVGRPPLRRMTRLEYNNTVRDLLGLETDVFMFSERLPFEKTYFDPGAQKLPASLSIRAREYGAKYPVLLPTAGLPADNRAEHGFSNRGDAQDFSDVWLSQYIDLAESIAFHPELLSRAERLQELFPHAEFRKLETAPASTRARQIVNTSGSLAPNGNVTKTAPGSAFKLADFQDRITIAFAEDRGGVYDVSENLNSTIPGKGGVLHLAFGENVSHVFEVNPSEDIWNAVFATGNASSGEAIFTNKKKGTKSFLLGFQKGNDSSWKGITELGLVLISRRGQSGTVSVSVEFANGETKSIDVPLNEGAGADNTFVSFAATQGEHIRKLLIDGSRFSGPYVLFDDLAFIADVAERTQQLVGIEKPNGDSQASPKSRSRNLTIPIDRSLARRSPVERIKHFLQLAFRRHVTDEEVSSFFRLYQSELALPESNDEQAMRRVIHGALASPSFLYVNADQDPKAVAPVRPLNDFELASRLSYFLWSSMPDDELLELARTGKLQDDAILEQQVARMLRDERVRELSENFFVEWLHLRELWSAQPDRREFAAFYAGPKSKATLADDMFLEVLLLFERVLIEDRSVLEFIAADSALLNGELAVLYGLSQEKHDDWRLTNLNNQLRGGILTSAAMLTLTSFPHRTSSIRRGSWILETIFNRPPPPPKIAVADIDEQEDVEHLTLRQKVERHRANAACAVCHDRIDPPGFVLENYDAIGRWRTKDGDEQIDPAGQLPGLGEFANASEFKSRLIQDRRKFVQGFTEHLLSYAIGRELAYYDVEPVAHIIANAEADNFSLKRIITEVVMSYPFRHIDTTATQADTEAR